VSTGGHKHKFLALCCQKHVTFVTKTLAGKIEQHLS